jgi:uncharacterized protein with ParB-like and HNH nuclease domain
VSTITPLYRNIKDLLSNQVFSIDEYQREYKWTKENILELVGDLRAKFFASYHDGDQPIKVAEYEDYFLGSIIVSRRGNKKYLVDGQQRTTSLTLLLIYLFHAADDKKLPLVNQLTTLIYSDNLGTHSFNLDIPERLPVINALFYRRDFSPDGKDESIQNMHARYQDLIEDNLIEDLGDAFSHFVYWLLTKVGLIEISTDNDNYAYAIFETMNDRGRPLSPVDMLKAYLLAPITDEHQRRLANQLWKKQVLGLISWGDARDDERDSQFFKAWLRAQYAETTRDRKAGAKDQDWELIGNAFHRWTRDHSAQVKLGAAEKNLYFINSNFPFFAQAYELILNSSHTFNPKLPAIFYNAHNEFTWQNTVLLAPLKPSDDAETTERKLALTSRFLDIWIMRRTVNYIRVGYSSVSYAMFQLCKEIRQKSLAELVVILTERLDQDDITFEGSPSRGRWGIDGLYLNQFSKRYIYHLLARVTSYVEKSSGQSDLFDHYVDRDQENPFDIEHITPDKYTKFKANFSSQAEFQEWRDHVAGLLLLPADVNRSFQDKPFPEKSPHYAKQNVYAASLHESMYQHQPKFKRFIKAHELSFSSYDQYGQEEQNERLVLLKQLVNLVWSPNMLKTDSGLDFTQEVDKS